jgi:protein SMG6
MDWRPLATPSRQRLFDHRKDDPVRFSVLARPSNGSKPPSFQKSSGDHVSASSTSSYAHSLASSFTLSSGMTDNSSTSSALFEGKPREEPGSNVFAVQLKKLYRNISDLESKILAEEADDKPDDSHILLHARARNISDEDLQQQKWLKLISDHKR